MDWGLDKQKHEQICVIQKGIHISSFIYLIDILRRFKNISITQGWPTLRWKESSLSFRSLSKTALAGLETTATSVVRGHVSNEVHAVGYNFEKFPKPAEDVLGHPECLWNRKAPHDQKETKEIQVNIPQVL